MVCAGCGLLCLHLSPEPGLNHKIDIIIICDIIAGNAWSVTSVSLQKHHFWHPYCSKGFICDSIITPNASSVTSLSLQTHICDIIITPNTSSVISLLLWLHDLWHRYHSKRIICDIIIAPKLHLWHHYHSKCIICDIIISPNASSVTSLSLWMLDLWHHYCSKHIICDIIAPNTSSVTSLSLWTHHLWPHYHSERIICDIIITLNASSVCLTSRPPPGFRTADDIQQNMSCAQPSSGVKLSTARICPRNTHAPQCKRTTLRPAQKFPPV